MASTPHPVSGTHLLQRLRSAALAIVLGGLLFGAMSTLSNETAAAQRVHRVRSGDSWNRIARRYRVRAFDLATHNRKRLRDSLRVGTRVEVPPRGVFYVRPGQTLAQIARERRVDLRELRRANRLRRNGRVRARQRLVLPGTSRRTKGRARQRETNQPVEGAYGEAESPGLVRLRTAQRGTEIRLTDAEGRVLTSGLRALGNLMIRPDRPMPGNPRPHPRLAKALAVISDFFGGKEIFIVSGMRPARGRTSSTSRHTSGRAVDIRIVGVRKRVLWEFCRTLPQTGCGLYPRSLFVHIDVRGGAAQWVDWSRPGQRSRYGNLRRAFPRRGRRRRLTLRRRITRGNLLPPAVTVVDDVAGGAPFQVRSREDAATSELLEEEGSDAGGEAGEEEVDPDAPEPEPSDEGGEGAEGQETPGVTEGAPPAAEVEAP